VRGYSPYYLNCGDFMKLEKFAEDMWKKYGKDYYEEGKEPSAEDFKVGDLVEDLTTGLRGIYLGRYPDNSIHSEGSTWSMIHIIGEEFSGDNYKTVSTKNLKLISRKEDRKNLKELEKEIKEDRLNRLKKHYGNSLV
jgi:hypothetical protein